MKMKRTLVLLAGLACAAAISAAAFAGGAISGFKIQSAATTTAKSAPYQAPCSYRTYQAAGTTSAGSGAAVILFQGSNVEYPTVDGDWVDLGTVSLTLATAKSGNGFASQAPWKFVRSWVTSISGTNASVDAFVGCGG